MNTPPPVSQRVIAERMGISQAAVSMALAGHPRISPAMREQVLSLAESLGYRPDPALRSLARYRKTVRPATYHATLAWVHSMPSADAWKGSAVYGKFFEHAAVRADRLGYKLDNFWIDPRELSDGRASQILINRGIRGLILMPHSDPHHRYEMEWDKFCALRVLDYTQDDPRLNMVVSDHYTNTRTALRTVLERGYQRPALLTARRLEDRLGHGPSSAFLGEMSARDADWAGVFWTDGIYLGRLHQWLEERRPDVLLLPYDTETISQVIDLLVRWGRRIPEELGVCMLCLPDKPHHQFSFPDLSGIDERWPELAQRSIDMLVHTLEHFEAGVPMLPVRHLMEGLWHEGATVRPASAH